MARDAMPRHHDENVKTATAHVLRDVAVIKRDGICVVPVVEDGKLIGIVPTATSSCVRWQTGKCRL